MKTRYWIAAVVLGAAATATVVPAATAFGRGAGMGPQGERPDFATLDADGDGMVTVAEIKAHAMARFDSIDADSDGVISAEELAAHAEAQARQRAEMMVARMIEWRDTDGDGALSPAEFGGVPMAGERIFRMMDRDQDGAISAEEFEQARERGRQHGPRGDGDGPRGHGERRGG